MTFLLLVNTNTNSICIDWKVIWMKKIYVYKTVAASIIAILAIASFFL